MSVKKKFDSADGTSIFFMVLYLAGAIYNAMIKQTTYVALWGTLFIINAGLFAYRRFKK